MRYVSTRGGMPPARFGDILLEGLAPDGGLAMPQQWPQVSAADLEAWRGLRYADLAFEIVSRFVDDIAPDTLRAMLRSVYTEAVFGSADITPVSMLESGLHLLHLSNGPTLAFKDIAMQLLGALFEHALARDGRELNILGATSGDTGSAAEYAMRGRRGVRVFMLSPAGRMSPFQTAQMFSLTDANIFNFAVDGVFDDCQDMVKAVSADLAFKRRLAIGTVNSINWARLLAQVVYYFKAWLAVTTGPGQRVSFTVPSGNFGNVCAGHAARQMGLPIARLVVATNENDVLDEFFRTGRYRVRHGADVHQTSSPSMDISKASNFERFVFDLVGRDAARTAALWREVDAAGGFDLGGTADFARVDRDFGFVSGASTHADRLATIRRVYRDFGVIVDTHTADGLKVAQPWREPGVPMVCLETAKPAKFAATIREALGFEPPAPPGWEDLTARPLRFASIGTDVDALKARIATAAGVTLPA
ncbi:MAG: threonine synthase [Burkholderiales bacterium]|nr:threonine synthase [Burkholderiales bacterium]